MNRIINHKLSLLSLILAAVLLIAGCAPKESDTGRGESTTTTQSEPTTTAQKIYQGSYFSLHYPTSLTLYENERPSVDGVIIPLENSITLQDSRFLLTITAFHIAPDNDLNTFIGNHTECLEVSGAGGQPDTLGNLPARVFADTLCGPTGITYYYAVEGNSGYRVTLESSESLAVIQPVVGPILDSFQSTSAPDPITRITHNGITLIYDASLLGEVSIEEAAPTADQGLFGQPTPAHTWFGFGADAGQGILENHWALTREAQIIVFNLNGFGSFAHEDERARQRIAAFQLLLEERPSSFTAEVPLLPPINAAQTIHSQVEWLTFQGGAGVRFLTSHTQEIAPLANDRLVYIFYGLTDDGQHGITAVFPIHASTLPDTPSILSDEEITALNLYYDEQMQAVEEQINALSDGDFGPSLSQLDALVQSIILPTEDDDFVTTGKPKNGEALVGLDILDAPREDSATIGRLEVGTAIVVNGISADGRYIRILCPDGTTANCWVTIDGTLIDELDSTQNSLPIEPLEGAIAQIEVLGNNVVFTAPDESSAMLGQLNVGQIAEVLAVDESGDWLKIACPDYIGTTCWVISNPDVNNPIGFQPGQE